MTSKAVMPTVGTFLTLLSLVAMPVLANDEPDELVAGRSAEIETLKHVKFTADQGPFVMPGATNDPTVEGATLRVFDTGVGGDDNTYALPAAGWQVGGGGFRYDGEGTLTDPCNRVDVLPDRIQARCTGIVTITPPLTGAMGVILTVGTDSKRYCLELGGAAIGNNEAGKFHAKDAPAPGACPTPPAPTPDVPVPGKTVVIQPGVKAVANLKADTGQLLDLPNFPDGNPLIQGATVEIFDTGGNAGSNTYNLPAGPKWTAVGSGYKYKGLGIAGDPCKIVRIKKNLVKVNCHGSDVTLTPPFFGDVAIRVTIGANAHIYCAQFDGSDEVSNTATFVKRRNVPAPAVCP